MDRPPLFDTPAQAIKDLKANYDNIAHPIAFSGVATVWRWYRGKVSIVKIREILAGFESYTLHREIKNGRRNPFFIYLPRWRMEMDLLDVGKLAPSNEGVTFIVMIIDCWTRKLWGVAVKHKTADEVLAAVKHIFDEIGSTPKYLSSDRGLEFTNKKMQAYCRRKKVIFTPNYNYMHAPFVERANRTFQKILYSWMTENETSKYLNSLQQLIGLYNMRHNRTMGMSPNQAELKKNHVQLRKNMELHYNKFTSYYKKKPQFVVGEIVRIAKNKAKFHRSYDEQTQQELFKIGRINTRLPIPTYTLTDFDGEEDILGNFYGFELTRVINDGIYRIEKVLDERVVQGEKQYFVRWKGFTSKHDSWTDASSVTREF